MLLPLPLFVLTIPFVLLPPSLIEKHHLCGGLSMQSKGLLRRLAFLLAFSRSFVLTLSTLLDSPGLQRTKKDSELRLGISVRVPILILQLCPHQDSSKWRFWHTPVSRHNH
jgi:hypothetical protein